MKPGLLQTWSRPVATATSSCKQPLLQPPKCISWSRRIPVFAVVKKGANRNKPPNKADLASKVCLTCGRPFTWRKKWEHVWDEVKYCSDRCKSQRPSTGLTLDTQQTSIPSCMGLTPHLPQDMKPFSGSTATESTAHYHQMDRPAGMPKTVHSHRTSEDS
eukprot:GHRR01009657.1.p1 GENE.GHRR01009657.1~~GHRR01009657.1.p1  ORF type:complete len:160 (+),score=29.37 GHRR01009657.1:237-716(+)